MSASRNDTFLFFVFEQGHALLAAVVDSPTSIHFLLLITLLVYVSMSGILQPKIQSDHSSNAASYVSSMYMGWGLMYSVAMLYMANNIPHDPSSARLQLVAFTAFLDCFLLIFGHTWSVTTHTLSFSSPTNLTFCPDYDEPRDSAPPMQTIMNCRLIYVVSWAALNMATYVLWGPFLSIPFVKGHT